MTHSLYKLKNVNQKQIILQALNGGLRVMSLDGTTTQRTSRGCVLSTPDVTYVISSEDYLRLSPLLRLTAR